MTDAIKSVGGANLGDDPNQVHQVLVNLDLLLHVTTNLDSCMIEALAAQGKRPLREIFLGDGAAVRGRAVRTMGSK